MHKITMDFLQEQYKKKKLIKSSDKGEVWLVTQEDDTPAIMRIINHLGIPGRLLRDNPQPLWPQILYFAEDESQQKTIIVEEYISGKSMNEYLEAGKHLSETEAKQLMLELCSGLSKLHALGIIHRDIKPSNIIRQSGGTGFKLIDFDAARIRNAHIEDQDTMLLGTKGYAPPEQYGYSQTDCRSDIFAVGVTMAELLGDDYKGLLRPIIKKCRALDPEMRYQSVEEIIQAIKMKRLFKNAMPLIGLLIVVVFLGAWYYERKPAENTEKQIEQQTMQEKTEGKAEFEEKEIPKIKEKPKTEELETKEVKDSKELTERKIELQETHSDTLDKGQDKAVIEGMKTNPDDRKLYSYGLKMETVGHGRGLSGGTAGRLQVSSEVYRYWPRENQDKLTGGYTVYLPDDWYIDVVIENEEWNGIWQNRLLILLIPAKIGTAMKLNGRRYANSPIFYPEEGRFSDLT